MIDYNDMIGQPFDVEKNNCYDVLREVFRRNGVIIPQTNISVCACKQASNQEIERHVWQAWQEIEKPEVPCGIVIKSTHPDFANHIGAYIGDGKFIHVTMNRSVSVDRVVDWKHKIIGYYRYVGNSHQD